MKKTSKGIIEHGQKNYGQSLFDRLSFFQIFVLWITIICLFGIVYYFISGQTAYLRSIDGKQLNFMDHIYFSFITATSTGFGDIVPMGYFKLGVLIEVIIGLTLLAIVTSKLVSIKQDTILNEVYEISLGEKVNSIRSALYLFRLNINRMLTKLEEAGLKQREIHEIHIYFANFESTLQEIKSIIDREKKSVFLKLIDDVNMKLILNSIKQSFDRIYELLGHLEPQVKADIAKLELSKSIKDTKDILAILKEQYDIQNILVEHDVIFEKINQMTK